MYSWSKPLYAVLGATITWTIAATFVVCLQCNPAQPWQTIDTDTGELMCTRLVSFISGVSDQAANRALQATQWAGIGTFDVITELAIFSVSVYMVSTLQMSFKSQAIVVFAFGCRLP